MLYLKDCTIYVRYKAQYKDTYNKLNVVLYCNVRNLDSLMLVDIDSKHLLVFVESVNFYKTKGQYKAICRIVREVEDKELEEAK